MRFALLSIEKVVGAQILYIVVPAKAENPVSFDGRRWVLSRRGNEVNFAEVVMHWANPGVAFRFAGGGIGVAFVADLVESAGLLSRGPNRGENAWKM